MGLNFYVHCCREPVNVDDYRREYYTELAGGEEGGEGGRERISSQHPLSNALVRQWCDNAVISFSAVIARPSRNRDWRRAAEK